MERWSCCSLVYTEIQSMGALSSENWMIYVVSFVYFRVFYFVQT